MKFSKIGIKNPDYTEHSDTIFANVRCGAFKILGLFYSEEEEIFRRVPKAVAEATSEGVAHCARQAAGGRIRFRTNSPYVAIDMKNERFWGGGNLNIAGIGGVDIYDGVDFKGALAHDFTVDKYRLVGTVELGDGWHDVTVHTPPFCTVKDIEIGLAATAEIEEARPYKYEKPVVFYGSSITHGACASRPGLSYENQLVRQLDFNYTNLGFSGSAKAEPAIAEYVANLDMSVFVYDYEHNTPSIEHLRESHERMFLTVREKHPDIPIIIISAPRRPNLDGDELTRREILRTTCENARSRGDNNVYFIAGNEFFEGNVGEDFSIDSCHPTDAGFYFMAKKVAPVLRKCLEDSVK